MKDIGTLGEKLVGKWLELHNYSLLQQNWRCRRGEIDIIAQDKVSKTVAFVEVKTRSSNNWDEGGLLAVNFSKQEKIIATAFLFLAQYPQLAELPCRFDVALVGYIAQRRQNSEKITTENIKELIELEIDQPVNAHQYQLTIKNYIQSAFDLS